jgi:hypothetical protein
VSKRNDERAHKAFSLHYAMCMMLGYNLVSIMDVLTWIYCVKKGCKFVSFWPVGRLKTLKIELNFSSPHEASLTHNYPLGTHLHPYY